LDGALCVFAQGSTAQGRPVEAAVVIALPPRRSTPWAATDSTEASTLIVDVVTLPRTTPTAGIRVVWMRALARGQ
jgi:hypothetical protein